VANVSGEPQKDSRQRMNFSVSAGFLPLEATEVKKQCKTGSIRVALESLMDNI
jgi:hypothetical protein